MSVVFNENCINDFNFETFHRATLRAPSEAGKLGKGREASQGRKIIILCLFLLQ